MDICGQLVRFAIFDEANEINKERMAVVDKYLTQIQLYCEPFIVQWMDENQNDVDGKIQNYIKISDQLFSDEIINAGRIMTFLYLIKFISAPLNFNDKNLFFTGIIDHVTNRLTPWIRDNDAFLDNMPKDPDVKILMRTKKYLFASACVRFLCWVYRCI
jgi:hypothetical protein